MQVSGRNASKTIVTFFLGGALTSACFGWLITRKSLESVWFTYTEWWAFPTLGFWLVAWFWFFLGLAIAYTVSNYREWLSLRMPVHRLLFAAILLTAGAPLLSWLLGFASLTGIILSPFIVALVLALALYSSTRHWDSLAAGLILVVGLVRTPLASIPDIIANGSMPSELFEALRSSITFTLLAGLSGLWLARSEGDTLE